jgi:hypothetical protein
MARGGDLLAMRDINIPIGGFIGAMTDVELVPVLWASPPPMSCRGLRAHRERDRRRGRGC